MPARKPDFNAAYSRVKWVPRTDEINVKELQAAFSDGEKPIFKIRQLSAPEFATAKVAVNRSDNLRSLAETLINATTKGEKTEALGDIMSMTAETEATVAFKLEVLVMGVTSPQLTLQTAVKIGINHPSILWTISDRIMELTQAGADVAKPPPSGNSNG